MNERLHERTQIRKIFVVVLIMFACATATNKHAVHFASLNAQTRVTCARPATPRKSTGPILVVKTASLLWAKDSNRYTRVYDGSLCVGHGLLAIGCRAAGIERLRRTFSTTV